MFDAFARFANGIVSHESSGGGGGGGGGGRQRRQRSDQEGEGPVDAPLHLASDSLRLSPGTHASALRILAERDQAPPRLAGDPVGD